MVVVVDVVVVVVVVVGVAQPALNPEVDGCGILSMVREEGGGERDQEE